MDKKLICDLKPGDETLSFFVLRKKQIKTKRDSGEAYLALEFGDCSGRIQSTLWDNVLEHSKALDAGDVVKVKGKVIHFKGRAHLTVEKIRTALEEDGVDFTQLIPATPKDRDLLFGRLDELIESIGNEPLSRLLEFVFKDDEIRKDFGNAPAGKLWHHAYLGGLLEHSLSVTDICDAIGKLYPGINRDLLIAGALLHDIGKIRSFVYKTLIDYTDEGRLVGHIVQGTQLVTGKIREIQDFPPELETQLLHLILSHQGKLEQASPVVPMTLEALILYYADEIDSKANAFSRIKEKDLKSGERWSSYVRLLDRYLYIGEVGDEKK